MVTTKFWSTCWLMGSLLAVPTLRAQTAPPTTPDDENARIASEIPGYGGLYLDTAGTTHVYLQDVSQAPAVQGLGDRVVVEQGDYDFRDLFAWKNVVRPQLSQGGAVFLDIDERRNRLVFGVERGAISAFTATLGRFLQSTQVPAAAVIVEISEPFATWASLTDRIRPVPAGVKIQGPGTNCTLGVNATRAGVRGFITNAHCSLQRGAVDGSIFFQNTGGASNLIGVETVDPPFFSGGSCPSGRTCRLSDATFVTYTSASLPQGGQIANPAACAFFTNGPLTISSTQPRLPVTSFLVGVPVPGSIVAKTGITTGCTFGVVTDTCTDVNVLGTKFTMLCQSVVSGIAAGGDSGSPVFVNGGNHATLSGVIWGGNSSVWAYSPWLFVFSEIGAVFPDAP